ncbi:uncharacterized protein LOC118766048 [Octopus sinensis]|uniref:Uncharacterized protein LOC118766048 n=1 Tax=Octopus sinensis TaxID=2607531 RepID=A0A7E6FCM2_9MOLL|nr:uncharacterized protein LOC118766048 [Octopus sinensis]
MLILYYPRLPLANQKTSFDEELFSFFRLPFSRVTCQSSFHRNDHPYVNVSETGARDKSNEAEKRTSTEFSQAYKTNNIVCYVCGCNCSLIGSRGHEAVCLRDWLKEHPGNEDYAPIQPENYPDPFNATDKNIFRYNSKAAESANDLFTYAPSAVVQSKEDVKSRNFPEEFEREVIPPKKFIRFEEQDEAQKKRLTSKFEAKSCPKKATDKPAKVLKHDDLVETLEAKACHIPKIPGPGRIPKGHEYAYTLDEVNSKNELILQPCFLATEELKKMGLPSYAGSASRKNLVITPKIATL